VLFPAKAWAGLADGSITVAFRSWKRPTVKEGGTLITKGGVLAIDAVERIRDRDITNKDAKASGAADRNAVIAANAQYGPERQLYRIRFHRLGDDPRLTLREQPVTAEDEAQILAALSRLDKASKTGPWTRRYLALIEEFPARRAPDLAEMEGLETIVFKTRVRRLKALGLTESLPVGYRLTPRYRSLTLD